MKINISKRKKKAFWCLLFGLSTLVAYVWFFVTKDTTAGILSILNTLFFFREEREFKALYGNKKSE